MGGTNNEEGYLLDVIRRLPLLTELRTGAHTRTELAELLGASKTTVHRATTRLEEHGLVERPNGEYCLTAIGEEVVDAAGAFRDRATAARRLEPLFAAVELEDIDLQTSLFADATVTVAEPDDPYAPVRRFTSLLRQTDQLRGFDRTTVGPAALTELGEQVAEGTAVELVYPPRVVRQLRERDSGRGDALLDASNVDLHVHEGVPFGLALFDERVGVGGYDSDTGMLCVYADTAEPDAVAWGEALFEQYRNVADPLDGIDIVEAIEGDAEMDA